MNPTTEVRGPLGVHVVESARRFGIDAFFTDRFGGVSDGPYESLNLGDHVGDSPDHVLENRRRVAAAIGVEPQRLVIARQVHGSDVVDVVDTADVGPDTCADALTTTSDVALAVLVADCVPLLFFDESSSRVTLAHAGWRGLGERVIERAVSTFAEPGDVRAVIGPCISAESYQVGPEVAMLFTDVVGALTPDGASHFRLSLAAVAADQLRVAGLSADHIEVARPVTDGGETFFSDRAARPCGRFALVARRVLA